MRTIYNFGTNITFNYDISVISKDVILVFENVQGVGLSWGIFQMQLGFRGTYEGDTKYAIGTLNKYRPAHQIAISVRSQHINAWFDTQFGGMIGSDGKIYFFSLKKFWDVEIFFQWIGPFYES